MYYYYYYYNILNTIVRRGGYIKQCSGLTTRIAVYRSTYAVVRMDGGGCQVCRMIIITSGSTADYNFAVYHSW